VSAAGHAEHYELPNIQAPSKPLLESPLVATNPNSSFADLAVLVGTAGTRKRRIKKMKTNTNEL